MKNHIMEISNEFPSMLGNSVVVTARLDESGDDMPFLLAEELKAVDVVDTPAVGDGMFSELTNKLLNSEQETIKEVNLMDDTKELLALKKVELAEEQLKARDAELTELQAKYDGLEKANAVQKVQSTVLTALSADDCTLPDAAKEKIKVMFSKSEGCDGLDVAISDEVAYIKSVQFKAKETEESDPEVVGLGHLSQNKDVDDSDSGQDVQMSALRAKDPNMSTAEAYKLTFKEVV